VRAARQNFLAKIRSFRNFRSGVCQNSKLQPIEIVTPDAFAYLALTY
jgi:hypothetical protein